MSRKKNESKNLFDGMPVEPEHAQPQQPESTPIPEEHEEESAVEPTTEAQEQAAADLQAPAEDQDATEPEDTSADDPLEDVRRSLIEEAEVREQQDQPRWWKRIGRGSRKSAPKQEPAVEEPPPPEMEPVEAAALPAQETEEEVDSIDDLIDLLSKEETAVIVPKSPVVEETPPEPEPVVDIEELKKQAFQPRPAAQEEDLTEVRSIALEGDEEVFVEVESKRQDPLEERLAAMENALKPYRRYINFGLAFLGLIMAVIAGLVLYNIYQRSVAVAAPPVVESNLPFPTSVSLPGGWTFKLGRGSLTDGQWNPKGAEWLQGTEVCRWVALPWSRQLEAVVRTLNPNDPIQLGMSNNDVLTYNVYSIKQMSPAEMQELDTNTPCLLIVLAEPEAEKRWVLTSLP